MESKDVDRLVAVASALGLLCAWVAIRREAPQIIREELVPLIGEDATNAILARMFGSAE